MNSKIISNQHIRYVNLLSLMSLLLLLNIIITKCNCMKLSPQSSSNNNNIISKGLSSSSSSSLSSLSFVTKKYEQKNQLDNLHFILEKIQRGGNVDDSDSDDDDSDNEEEEDINEEDKEEEEESSSDDYDDDDESESEYDEDDYDYDESESEDDENEYNQSSSSSSSSSKSKSIIEYDEPLSLSPLTDMGVTIGVMVLCNKLDLSNTKIIRMARYVYVHKNRYLSLFVSNPFFVYFILFLSSFLLWGYCISRFAFIAYVVIVQLFLIYVRFQAHSINDRTPITINNPLSNLLQNQLNNVSSGTGVGGGGGDIVKNMANSFLSSQSTILEYDLSQVKSMNNSLLFPMLMLWFLHFKMGQVQPLFFQTASGVKELIMSPLFQVYVLGRNLERPFRNLKMEEMKKRQGEELGEGEVEGDTGISTSNKNEEKEEVEEDEEDESDATDNSEEESDDDEEESDSDDEDDEEEDDDDEDDYSDEDD